MLAINAGVDMMMVPSQLTYGPLLSELVKEGKVPLSRINDAVRRILRLKFRLNLFDVPLTSIKDYPDFGSAKHAAVALQAAEESEILLKNDDHILPLKKGKRIFVCGPNANSVRTLNGGWSTTWQGDNSDSIRGNYNSIYKALQNKFGTENVTYEPGVVYSSKGPWYEDEVQDIDKAVAAASSADYVVVCVGENSYAETVGNITDLNLTPNQKNLVKAMQKTGKPVILILNEGRPRLVYDLVKDSKSVVDIMLPGNYGGDALANLLSGDANFSGKLPITYPLQPNALTNYDYKVSDQNVSLTGTFDYSYRGHASYQWQFGTGLSYTSFQYSNFKANKTSFNAEDELEFSIDVKNTGDKTGKESILLYSSDLYASLMPDNKRLRAFDKIELKPGELQNVKFRIKASDLAFVGADGKWVLEKGDFTISAGTEKLNISCNQTHKWDTPNIEP
jgi:beta-glucosidase